jgi:hypothetical protein
LNRRICRICSSLAPVPDRLPLGSELWTLRYDNEVPRYVPKLEGRVEGVRGDEYLVAGRWRSFGYPHFGSEAEPQAWCKAHPPNMPTIK